MSNSIEQILDNLNTPRDSGYTGELCPHCNEHYLYRYPKYGKDRVVCFHCNTHFSYSGYFGKELVDKRVGE